MFLAAYIAAQLRSHPTDCPPSFHYGSQICELRNEKEALVLNGKLHQEKTRETIEADWSTQRAWLENQP